MFEIKRKYFIRFKLNPGLTVFVQYLRRTQLKFKPLPAHILKENAKVQITPAFDPCFIRFVNQTDVIGTHFTQILFNLANTVFGALLATDG